MLFQNINHIMQVISRYRYSILLAAAILLSCKKTMVNVRPLASLNMVNATVNLDGVQANFTRPGSKAGIQYYSDISTVIGYGTNSVYSMLAKQGIPLTVVSGADTTKTIFEGSFNFNEGGIYTLYFSGIVGAIDTLLVAEKFPVHTDSTCGIRFINLSFNSQPIVVTQPITPTLREFNSLSYKQFSDFKGYPAGLNNNEYTFQVRDAATDSLLGTYNFSAPCFRNVTLAWIGQIGGSDTYATQVIMVNNY